MRIARFMLSRFAMLRQDRARTPDICISSEQPARNLSLPNRAAGPSLVLSAHQDKRLGIPLFERSELGVPLCPVGLT